MGYHHRYPNNSPAIDAEGRGSGAIDLRNRFGEPVAVERAGAKVDLTIPLEVAVERAAAE